MAEWISAAEPIALPIMVKFIKICGEHLNYQPNMKDDLERLRENYPKIQFIFSNAKRAQTKDQNSELNPLIWQLRDAIDEADDFLDELEYKKLKQLVRRKFVKNKFQFDADLSSLPKVVQKLNRILADFSTLFPLLQQEQHVGFHQPRETGSTTKCDLIVRAKVKESVVDWLTKEYQTHQTHATSATFYNNISLLSIVGHGGMGKTTLLRHVYEDQRIIDQFGVKMWVCVPKRIDVNEVITDMLECVNHNRTSNQKLDTLQQTLKFKVKSKKFLLVLDDLWDTEHNVLSNWGDVLAPLANGASGSKILLTTRADSAASMIRKVINKKGEVLKLEGLEEDECFKLLIAHAFYAEDNPDDHENLKSIARELVRNLYGSPLAAQAMGVLLKSSSDELHWTKVLNDSSDRLTEVLNDSSDHDIISILKLSYTSLPDRLQKCFSFCSIFPENHDFDKDELVRMWIAVGFIQSSHNNQGETLEDVGERYFDVLIKKSFFEEVSTKKYKMHGLLYKLAQHVSAQECSRFVCDDKLLFLEIPDTIRHLSIQTSNLEVLKEMGRFKKLKTLIITCNNQSLFHALDEMLKVTKSIRLLHINDRLQLIPESIECLHHLRYLRFPCPDVKKLPTSLSRLYHLWFIILDENFGSSIFSNDCFLEDINLDFSNDYFPRDMNNLSNLHYLSSRRSNFPGIGKLKLLQDLYGFCIKNEDGYKIEELKHMNELRILGLTNLKDVRDAEEACKAKLCDKTKLVNLFLNWNHAEGDNADFELDERVLENLQPYKFLKTLHMKHYMGASSANWMKNLQEIYLFSCLNWEILPTFGQFSILKTLLLENMPKVKQLPNNFPLLERLVFRKLEALVNWFDERDDCLFPCLTTLRLYNCPNLQELPNLPPKLKLLEIDDIGWKTLNCCNISESIPLQTLAVSNCENIKSISTTFGKGKLKILKITNCSNLNETSISQTSEIVRTFGANKYKYPPFNIFSKRTSRSGGR